MSQEKVIHAPKGMNDVLPGATEGFLDSSVWARILEATASVLGSFGYRPAWLPSVEETPLFARGIGADTDIVAKEMFSFADRAGRPLTLRPEATASAARAYIEHDFSRRSSVQRWWYFGPMFRAEAPQKGRYRQFYQLGAELFGVAEPIADAELLLMLHRLCERLGLAEVELRLNSVGDAASRRAYPALLRAHLEAHAASLCESCRGRLASNPLRALDCKREGCRQVAASAPDILDSLSEAARGHFERVQALLGELGVPHVRDRLLVRGLDYYTGTTFELLSGGLGAQNAILGGGRYDGLVEELGGPPTPAIGFAAGVERIALLLAQAGVTRTGPTLYMIPMEGAEARTLALADALRRAGMTWVEVDVGGGRIKQKMRRADRAGARAALVLGGDELASGRGRLKDLVGSRELEVELDAETLRAAAEQLTGAQEPIR